MSLERPLRAVRRCPGCGSRLPARGRHCAICGEPVPRRLRLPGIAVESMLAVVAVAAVATGLLWVRERGGRLVSPSGQIQVIARLPTEMPTFTPSPVPPATRPPNTPRPPTPTPLPPVVIHEVVSGDTLYGIAARYGVTGEAILEANAGVLESPDRLSVGQELRIPVTQPPAQTVEEPARGADMVAEAAGESLPGGQEEAAAEPMAMAAETYVTRAGDTVGSVAAAYGMAAEELRELNPDLADPRVAELEPGLELVVRPAETAGALTAPVVDPLAQYDPARVMEPEPGEELFPAPLALAPGDRVTVTVEAPLLRWSSAGLLPDGVYYVVTLRDALDPDARPRYIWVTSNATAVRVPADFRPALGSRRTIAWSVSVRRRRGGLLGSDQGLLLSPNPEWRVFTWAP